MNARHSGFRSGDRPALAVSDDLRRGNIASVARTLLVEGPLARAELAERLSLTRATVTRVVAQLLEVGLLTEGEARRVTAGRPMIPLRLDPSARAVISIHLGAFEVRVGLVDISGHVLREERFSYDGSRPEDVSALLAHGVEQVRSHAVPGVRVLGMSASIGGWVDPTSSTVVRYDPLGWQDVPLREVLPDLGIPRRFDQLVRGVALAERMFGVARGREDFVVLWSGNILGAASVARGVVQHGLRGGAGGIEHLPTGLPDDSCACGRTGCLGVVATDEAIRREAEARGILRPGGSLSTLLGIVADGDPAARQLLEERAEAFGSATGVLADFRAPELIVVAGLVTTAPEYLAAFTARLHAVSALGAVVDVRRSEFGDLAPTIASAAFLIDEYFRDPISFE
ncbi:ROK family transcriptional regulator [Microbacterium panaciterrae]|uniref:ROK family transcriptional regulator n=1 Tax=Microbacterium panaciterrae TaxID=985759 RepID=A0ABP8P4K2_9MICO